MGFAGKCVVCFSHAASLAFVAALTGRSLLDAGTFAPAGIFKLVSHDGTSWALEAHGGDNSGHVLRNDPNTFPWGFQHCFKSYHDECTGAEITTEEQTESAWEQAKAVL